MDKRRAVTTAVASLLQRNVVVGVRGRRHYRDRLSGGRSRHDERDESRRGEDEELSEGHGLRTHPR
jgi:hypothetical protein